MIFANAEPTPHQAGASEREDPQPSHPALASTDVSPPRHVSQPLQDGPLWGQDHTRMKFCCFRESTMLYTFTVTFQNVGQTFWKGVPTSFADYAKCGSVVSSVNRQTLFGCTSVNQQINSPSLEL